MGRPGVHPASLDKLRRLRGLLGDDVELEVDGGIDERTAGPCAEAGATLFVGGRRSSATTTRGPRCTGSRRRGRADDGGGYRYTTTPR